MKPRSKSQTWWAACVLLLLLIFATRTWNLTEAPPGLTHDEASNGHDSAAILDGVHRIYFPVGYGHEPLYNYSVALSTLFLGQGIFTLRITTVFWSLAQCVLAVALARRWWGRPTALAVLAAYSVSFWALMFARVGLRAPVLPALFTAAALAYDHAITGAPERAWRGYGLAGLFLGASLYTYMASRGMPLVFPLFLLALAVAARMGGTAEALRTARSPRGLWPGTLAMLGLALAIGAPLFLHLRANPGLEQRIGQLSHALHALRAGDWRPLWSNVGDSLPMLVWQGDPYWLYNVAGRPGLEPLLAVGFGIGLLHALVRIRDRRHLFLLLWLAGGVAPALIAPVAYNLLRAVAALPAVLLIAGRGLTLLLSAAASLRPFRRHPAGTWILAALAGSLFIATGREAARAYFVTWANQPEVRVAYHHHLVALGHRLAPRTSSDPVMVSSLYPGEFHDPYTMEVSLSRIDPALRWADGRTALFVPTQTTQLFTESRAQPGGVIRTLILPDLTPEPGLIFRERDLVGEVQAYRWNAPATWERMSRDLVTTMSVQSGDPAPGLLLDSPGVPDTPTAGLERAPVTFGDILALEGYAYNPGIPESGQLGPGSALTLLTAWTVLAPTQEEWVIFAHLLDAEGDLIAQDDRLDAPSWQWQPGDRFVQVHHLVVRETTEPGPYAVGLGLYARRDLRRLEIPLGSAAPSEPATRALLPLGGIP